MKFNKSPLMWTVVGLLIVLALFRLVVQSRDEQDGSAVILGVAIAVVIVVVVLLAVKFQGSKQQAAVAVPKLADPSSSRNKYERELSQGPCQVTGQQG